MGGTYKWPELDDVVEYRKKVKALILKKIEEIPLQLPVTMESPWVDLFITYEMLSNLCM